jgi:DNA-binding transcriptional LysR family regulator
MHIRVNRLRLLHRVIGMDIDLHKLRHVVAVAREGSFIAAAAALPLSQSALTRSVQSLEREVGFPIFERGRYGVLLTSGGAELVQLAEDLLARSEHVARELRALRDGTRSEPVRMGVGSITAAAIMPSLLPRILDRCPSVHVTVETNSRLNWMLSHNELDFYIGGVPADSDNFATANRFEARNFEGGAVSLLVRQDHPLLQSTESGDETSRYPVAAGTFAIEAWAEPEIQCLGLQRPAVVSDDYALLAELAKQSDYLLIASGILARFRPDLGLTVLAPIQTDSFLQTRWVLMSHRQELMTANARDAADMAFSVLQDAILA